MAFECVKKSIPSKSPSIIHLSGQVIDKQSQVPLDSNHIYLMYEEKTCIGCIAIPKDDCYTNKSGNFNLQFSPQTGYSYYLGFQTLHSGENRNINLEVEYQEFKVALDK